MKKIYTIYKEAKSRFREEFYVEELRSKKWKPIPDNPGPYASYEEADIVAREYSKRHPGVGVRVVGEG